MTEEEKRDQIIDSVDDNTESLDLDFGQSDLINDSSATVSSSNPFIYGDVQTTTSEEPFSNVTPNVFSYQEPQVATSVEPVTQNPYGYAATVSNEVDSNSFSYQEPQVVVPVEPVTQNPYGYTETVSNVVDNNSFSYQEPQVVISVEPVIQDPYGYTETVSNVVDNNLFSYQEPQAVTPVEPVVQNQYDYVTPSDQVMVEPQAESTNSSLEQHVTDNFSYVEANNSQQIPDKTPQTYNPNVNFPTEDTTRIAADTKSNLVFVAIFGIAMLIIIFVLPYISGYK